VPDLTNLAWLNHYYFTESESDDDLRGVSFSRWAGWGDQKYPIHFSGDASTGWPMLAFEVPFTATSGNVGCFFWTHDIGGHRLGRNEESYTRWCQFGALSAALRSHSTRDATMDRRPWKYPKWAEDSMRISFQLRAKLMPYIYTSAQESCRDSVPLLRPVYFENPEAETAYHQAQEYYFGDNLLVAPIATPGQGPSRTAWQTVWFPPGEWFNYFTGEKYDGGTEALVACDINQFPLFVRGGVPLPMQPFKERPATAALDHLVIRCYPGDGMPHTVTLYEDDGVTKAYTQSAFASTGITCGASSIVIAPTQGHYDGQVPNRSYTIEIPCATQSITATVDGTPAALTYVPQTFTARIEIASRPISQGADVQIQGQSADPEIIRQAAIAQRLSGIVGQTILGDSVKQMLDQALAIHPELATPILASVGVGVVNTNDAPYLYHGHHALQIFNPPGIVDAADATASLGSGSEPIQFTDGGTIDYAPMVGQLPDEDSIIVPGKSEQVHADVKIDGRTCDLTCAIPQIVAPKERDLARSAHVTASSTEDGYRPEGVNDGVADGYPGDKRHEWASNNEKGGAWIKLSWDSDQTISHVLLFDRISSQDHILAGRVAFSNGSEIPFGELSSDPTTPVHLDFAPKTVSWLRVEIDKVAPSTISAGLTEIGVFK
jgi:Glycosyl hydrolases family 31/Domain of unknown function (DUF5110)